MIHDNEFTAYAEHFSVSSGLDSTLLHRELREPLSFVQNELKALADVREPSMITIACKKGGNKPFFRIVWIDEDDPEYGIELFVGKETTTMWVNGDEVDYSFETVRGLLPLMAAVGGHA